MTERFDPWGKLRAISARPKQLWTVVYVEESETLETARRDVEASLSGGADAVVLEIGRDPEPLAEALRHVRRAFPQAKVGVNYLGGEGDPYGYLTGFRLAKELDLAIVWTDFSGVDRIEELSEASLHDIEAHRAGGAFYCSGIHMKYGTLLDRSKTIERSALQAMGFVEGIVVTGPRTGVATDPEQARRAKTAIGRYPLGAASGVTAENVHELTDTIDFCLVNTSIADAQHRIQTDAVRRLRQALDLRPASGAS